jgi:hypothetical protein
MMIRTTGGDDDQACSPAEDYEMGVCYLITTLSLLVNPATREMDQAVDVGPAKSAVMAQGE